jgi:SAM-dependent methyltransferase
VKPVLRAVYEHLYRKIVAACRPGLTLEVGGGSGNLKTFLPDAISFDIVPAPWLDFVADAQALPIRSRSAANIVMFDVLHHIEYPLRFLREANRILQPGGRVVMLEPGITPLSLLFYKYLHQEPVLNTIDPLADGQPDPGKDPYVGNQAIPTLLVTREAQRLANLLPDLAVVRTEWLSLFAYPLSGGFKRWSLVTPSMARVLLRLEDRIAPTIGRFCAFRLMTVLEKNA